MCGLSLVLSLWLGLGSCTDSTAADAVDAGSTAVDDATDAAVDSVGDAGEKTDSHPMADGGLDAWLGDSTDADGDGSDGDGGLPPCTPLPSAPTASDVQTQVFNISCTFSSCHGAAKKGELDLRAPVIGKLVGVKSTQNPAQYLVVPGSPADSWLWHKVAAKKPTAGDSMPPLDDGLDAARRKLLKDWILNCALP